MKRVLKIVAVVVLLLPFIAVIGLRSSRHMKGAVTTLKPGIVAGSAGGAGVFAAKAGSKVLLFDAGMDPDGGGIDALLESLKATRADVSDVFVTHGHPDHIAALPLFPNAKVHAGAGDAGLLAGTEGGHTTATKIMGALMPALPPMKITDPLTTAMEIPVEGGKSVKAWPIPGHSAGSFAYLYDGVLFMGDTVNVEADGLATTPAAFNPDPEANLKSVKALRPLLPADVEILCSGHGGCTASGKALPMYDDFVKKNGG